MNKKFIDLINWHIERHKGVKVEGEVELLLQKHSIKTLKELKKDAQDNKEEKK